MRRRWENELPLDALSLGVQPVWTRWHLRGLAPDVSDVVAARLPGSPHLLAVWEPLRTKAPSPAHCQPYCCLIDTVIFYHRPYIVGSPRGGRDRDGVFHADWNRGFVEFDQIKTRLNGDDLVSFDGDTWEIGGGHVHWHRRRWWMRRWARRRAAA